MAAIIEGRQEPFFSLYLSGIFEVIFLFFFWVDQGLKDHLEDGCLCIEGSADEGRYSQSILQAGNLKI